jgi:hypothetical protein
MQRIRRRNLAILLLITGLVWVAIGFFLLQEPNVVGKQCFFAWCTDQGASFLGDLYIILGVIGLIYSFFLFLRYRFSVKQETNGKSIGRWLIRQNMLLALFLLEVTVLPFMAIFKGNALFFFLIVIFCTFAILLLRGSQTSE